MISNKPDAKIKVFSINYTARRIAQKLGVKTEVIESKGFKGSRAEYDKKIISA